MAETYDTYLKNKAVGEEDPRPPMDRLLDAAVSQTELLQDVRTRVETFVKAYQRWADLDEVYHVVKGLPHEADQPEPLLYFDDLRILLERFPQQ